LITNAPAKPPQVDLESKVRLGIYKESPFFEVFLPDERFLAHKKSRAGSGGRGESEIIPAL
jgi:hypothetical protein